MVRGRQEAEAEGSWSLESSDLLRLMVEAVTDYAILWLDTEGHIRSWNPGAERIKGYRAEEIIGRHFSAFYPEDAVNADVPRMELRVATEVGRFEDEGWRVRKDGTQFWANVVITALRDERGILVGFAKLTRDLTGRKAAERELADANAMVTSVLESTSDVVIQVDFAGVIVYQNRRAVERFPECRLYRNLWECYPELNGSDAFRYLRAGVESRVEAQAELYFARRDTWYSATAYPGERGVSLFLRDITRERALAQELQKAQLMREKRIVTMSHLAGGLTHEISNPLAIIHAVACDLKLSVTEGMTVSDAEVVKACDQIVLTSDRALAILRGLKAFSREASRDPMVRSSVERIVQGCLDMQHSRLERHKVELRLTVEPDIPPVLCREVQIGQIVTNLVNNAFDSVKTRTEGERWVSMKLTADAENVCLEVTDSGPGIPEELWPRLMEPFFTTKESSGGTGIGLSLSRGIAQDHGGDLEFCTAEGKWYFRLLLPTERMAVARSPGETGETGGVHEAR